MAKKPKSESATVTIEAPKDQSDHEVIQKMRRGAEPIIRDVRIAAETTGTEGWQRLYQTRKKSAKAKREAIAKRMHEYADQLEDLGWSDDDEKGVKTLAKDHTALREDETAFDLTVARPVYEAVHRLERHYASFRTTAGDFERNAPLTSDGLVEAMELAITAMPSAVWDDSAGVVRLTEGSAA